MTNPNLHFEMTKHASVEDAISFANQTVPACVHQFLITFNGINIVWGFDSYSRYKHWCEKTRYQVKSVHHFLHGKEENQE